MNSVDDSDNEKHMETLQNIFEQTSGDNSHLSSLKPLDLR